MANKIARVAYAVMTTGKPYDPAIGAIANGCPRTKAAQRRPTTPATAA